MRSPRVGTALGRLSQFVALRYRLQWAHVRSRNGRIALFMAAYVALAFVAIMTATGGLAAAAASARTGRGELLASAALTAVFVNATLAALVLGIGVDESFSDAALRRYPMTRASRVAVRHLIALADPVWVVAFALVLGLAAGFVAVEPALLSTAPLGALLFLVSTSLVARTSAQLRVWLSSKRAGAPLVILGGIGLLMLLPLLPVLLFAPGGQGRAPAVVAALAITPPLAAASAVAGSTAAPAAAGLALLAGWCVGLSVLLAATERLPIGRERFPRHASRWDGAYDRASTIAGRRLAPLTGKFLRYHVRGSTRWNYPFVLPMLILVSKNFGDETFLFALAVAPAAGFLSTVPSSLNLFGCDGSGFRRYLLLPVSAADIFRTAALAGLVPGAALIPAGVMIWLGLAARPVDVRMPFMLLSTGFGGLLFFHALGLWTSLLSPRRIPFELALGNNLSAPANVLMGAAMITVFFLPLGLTRLDQDRVLELWWTTPLALVVAGALYAVVLNVGGSVFAQRREPMLDALERRG